MLSPLGFVFLEQAPFRLLYAPLDASPRGERMLISSRDKRGGVHRIGGERGYAQFGSGRRGKRRLDPSRDKKRRHAQ